MTRAAGFLIAMLAVAGCSRLAGTSLDPSGLFTPPQPRTYDRAELPPLVQRGEAPRVIDRRPLVSRVTALRLEPASEGAIVTAEGIAPDAGAFNAQLTRVGYENGTMVYAFRAELPPEGPGGQRRLTSAVTIGPDELPFVRAVRVVGAGNTMTARR